MGVVLMSRDFRLEALLGRPMSLWPIPGLVTRPSRNTLLTTSRHTDV